MQQNNENDRLDRIREKIAGESQPKHNRRSTDRAGVQLWGGRNIYATNVIYQFSEPASGKATYAQSFAGVDWRVAPKLARWWAMDADGQAHWFCMPNIVAFTALWYAEPLLAPSFGFDGDWRESLVERPPLDQQTSS